jgi:hypothetical protein
MGDIIEKLLDADEPLSDEDVMELLRISGYDAEEILWQRVPTAKRKFKHIVKLMKKLLGEVKEHFPDARFYTSGGDGLSLLIAAHHDENDSPRYDVEALAAVGQLVEGGDW